MQYGLLLVQIYDLYIGEVGQAIGSTENCPAEGAATYKTPEHFIEENAIYNIHAVDDMASRAVDALNSADRPTTQSRATSYATPSNQICESDLKGGPPTCICVPMKRGPTCSEGI